MLIAACRGLLAALLAVAAFGAIPAAGQETPPRLEQFRHDRWMTHEGAPAGMARIAQTPDGWIWISAAEGLFRFDGLTFERIPVEVGSALERASAGPLLVTRSGELWVGYGQSAGVAVYRGGKLRQVPMPSPPATISYLAQTPDGAIWAVAGFRNFARERLFRFAGGRWENAEARYGVADGYLSEPCVTADGTMWLTRSDTRRSILLFLRPGATRFQASAFPLTGSRCFTDRWGRLWVPGKRLVMLAGRDGKLLDRPPGLRQAATAPPILRGFGADGGLWGLVLRKGVYYAPGVAEAGHGASDQAGLFSVADGLTSESIADLFIDRDGDIWVATQLGLDRFRRATAVREPFVTGNFSYGLGMSQSGSEVYVSSDQGVFQFSPGQPRKLLNDWPDGQCPARGKGLWLIYRTRVVRLQEGRQSVIPRPSDEGLTSVCAEDRFGRLWVGTVRNELRWHDARGWHVPGRKLPRPQSADLVITAAGDLAYTTGTDLVQVIGEKVSVTPLGKHDPGVITHLSAGIDALFLSGSNGLLRIRGNRIDRLDWRRVPWAAQLRDLLQTPAGDTWLMRRDVISRVSTRDLERAFGDPGAALERIALDLRDGVRISQNLAFAGPQLAFGADGRVWQLNNNGIAFIDPAQLLRKAARPPVTIRALTSAGAVHRDPAALILSPGTHAFDIDYTALSYAYPERLRFRYRLEGVDADWVDAGSRRLASYANLGPGSYRFRVVASDNRQDWSKPGAALDIVIKPTFVQGWPFKLLCAILLLGLLWLAYSLRLRAVANRIQLRMADRMAERERIARELHDTLLQGIQGLMMRFQVVADRITDPVTRQSLDRALDSADAVVIEGRERVRDLRCVPEAGELAHKIDALVETMVEGDGSRIRLSVSGGQRPLCALVTTEALRIVEEALRNALHHAAAESISVGLEYGRRQFVLSIRDTGVGIPEEILAAGSRSGHYGLIGMRERASRVGGRLDIVGRKGDGTEVVLRVPARAAYAERRRVAGWLQAIRGGVRDA